MRVVKLPPGKMTSGTAMLNAFYGGGSSGKGSFVRRVEDDQQQGCTKDAIAVETIYNTPDEWDRAVVNKTRISPYQGKASALTRRMKLSTAVALYSSGEQAGLDLAKVLREIKVILVRNSPVRSASMRGPHRRGLYRRNHQIRVNGAKIGNPSPGSITDPSAYGQVFNRVDYASTLEKPNWKKPYQKAYKKVVKRFGKDWDLRLEFAQANEFGGNIKTSRYTAKRKTTVYAIPVITVAPLNTLSATSKSLIFVRRRNANQSRNPLSKSLARRR